MFWPLKNREQTCCKKTWPLMVIIISSQVLRKIDGQSLLLYGYLIVHIYIHIIPSISLDYDSIFSISQVVHVSMNEL